MIVAAHHRKMLRRTESGLQAHPLILLGLCEFSGLVSPICHPPHLSSGLLAVTLYSVFDFQKLTQDLRR